MTASLEPKTEIVFLKARPQFILVEKWRTKLESGKRARKEREDPILLKQRKAVKQQRSTY